MLPKDHTTRIEILRRLIDEYNVTRANTPAILKAEKQHDILVCIVERMEGILSPYVEIMQKLHFEQDIITVNDRDFINNTITMLKIIKNTVHMKRQHIVQPKPVKTISVAKQLTDCPKITILKRQNSKLNAFAKEFIPGSAN